MTDDLVALLNEKLELEADSLISKFEKDNNIILTDRQRKSLQVVLATMTNKALKTAIALQSK